MNQFPCGSCRLWGRDAPWAFLLVAAILALLPLGEIAQRSSAYLTVAALVLLAGSYVAKRVTPGRRRY
jgi:hypothetical protein